MSASTTVVRFGHKRFLLQVSLQVATMAQELKEIGQGAEGTQDITQLDLRHNECRRARKSQGYKAQELQPHYPIQLKYKKCGHDRTPQMCEP